LQDIKVNSRAASAEDSLEAEEGVSEEKEEKQAMAAARGKVLSALGQCRSGCALCVGRAGV
jgi:hypothetical protein